MTDLVEEGKAKAAGVTSILIGVCAFIELVCGFIYLSKGGPEGSGLWSGFGVNISNIVCISCIFTLYMMALLCVIFLTIVRDCAHMVGGSS